MRDDVQITIAIFVLWVSVFNSPSNSSRVENVLLIIAFERNPGWSAWYNRYRDMFDCRDK